MLFEGTAVAMVTPFLKDGSIDEEGFRQNINWLIERDVDGLVAAPTTGESATLSHPEHQEVIKILVDEVDKRVTTIAGTGSNATDEAISLTKAAEDYGADMTLLITPYYNKPHRRWKPRQFRLCQSGAPSRHTDSFHLLAGCSCLSPMPGTACGRQGPRGGGEDTDSQRPPGVRRGGQESSRSPHTERAQWSSAVQPSDLRVSTRPSQQEALEPPCYP